MFECLGEWKPGFFSFGSFLNMLNRLYVICNHLVLNVSSQLTKKPVSTLPNSLAARIYVEIGN